MPIASILVYTDGEVMGDGILSLSFAQALKDAAPAARLIWASDRSSVFATSLKAIADSIIDEHLLLPTRAMPLSDYLLGPAPLRGRRFDLILDPQTNVKRTLWLKRIAHGRFVSFAGGQVFSSARCREPIAKHVFERLMQLGSTGLGVPLHALPLPLPPGSWREEARALLPDGARYIGFIVGAGKADKCWPLAQFMTLAQSVAAQGFTPVMFLGPQESAMLAALKIALPTAKFPLNEAANPAPYLTIALAARLTAAVANDSGGGHLLAEGGSALVSLFRSTSVRSKFLPRAPRVVALAKEDFGVATMQDISYAAVKAALDSLIA